MIITSTTNFLHVLEKTSCPWGSFASNHRSKAICLEQNDHLLRRMSLRDGVGTKLPEDSLLRTGRLAAVIGLGMTFGLCWFKFFSCFYTKLLKPPVAFYLERHLSVFPSSISFYIPFSSCSFKYTQRIASSEKINIDPWGCIDSFRSPYLRHWLLLHVPVQLLGVAQGDFLLPEAHLAMARPILSMRMGIKEMIYLRFLMPLTIAVMVGQLCFLRIRTIGLLRSRIR